MNRFNLSNIKFSTKFLLAFGLIAGIVLVTGTISYIAFRQLSSAMEEDRRTNEALTAVNNLERVMVGCETGIRGYLLTSRQTSLESYESCQKSVPLYIEELKAHAAYEKSDEEFALIANIQDEIDKWQKKVALPILNYMENPSTQILARSIESSGTGKFIFDGLREYLTKYQEKQRKSLADNIEYNYKASTFMLLALVNGIIIVIIVSFVCWALVNSQVIKPLGALTHLMGSLGNESVRSEIPHKDRHDEIGDVARAIETFRDSIFETQKLEHEKAEAQTANIEKQAILARTTSSFVVEIESIVSSLVQSSSKVKESAQDLTKTAEETTNLSNKVSSTSEQTSNYVSTVATGAEELTFSIQEIERQIYSASQLTNQAVEHAGTATSIISNLANATHQINAIVNLINDIASRTNLLALNATIEAARAGEYGKGFAVVASEVKALASQTARATEDIEREVEGIQSESIKAVKAVESITEVISGVAEITATVSAAVSEQTSATQEISRNVMEVSRGSKTVSNDIGNVNKAAISTGVSALTLSEASDSLANVASRLQKEVNSYVTKTRG
ncbi:MAG: methyl-accepting chemotaxis protein [Alphaproteobacteria bacterium]|nr:methyl-accepting chemotaxis protein [Alphaproteobacteria bacterium]